MKINSFPLQKSGIFVQKESREPVILAALFVFTFIDQSPSSFEAPAIYAFLLLIIMIEFPCKI